MPNAAATSLGSMVLTRSTRRVQRSTRGGTPQASSTWLTYAVDAGVRWALVPRVTITCGLSVARRSRWARLRCSTVQLAGSSGTGWGRCPSRIVQAAGSIWSTRSSRTSRLEAPCSNARTPSRASWGWTSGSVIQRRNSRRCASRSTVAPVQPLASGEAEELPQHGQPSLAAVGQGGQERLDVTHVHQRPVQLAAHRGQEAGEVAQGGQGRLDGAVGAWAGAGPAGTLTCPQHPRSERRDRRAERVGSGVDAALAASGGQPGGLVGGHRQPLAGEEA